MKSNINESPLSLYRKIPKSWPSRPKTVNYDKLPPTEHYADGWRDVVQPQFNTETHKRDNTPFYDDQNDWVTYGTIALTQEEIDRREQQALDSDQAASSLQNDISNGQIMYQRLFAHIKRKFDEGYLTGAQAKNSAQLLWMPLLPINYGQFLVAKLNLNDLTEPTDSKELELLNIAKTKVNDYLSTS